MPIMTYECEKCKRTEIITAQLNSNFQMICACCGNIMTKKSSKKTQNYWVVGNNESA